MKNFLKKYGTKVIAFLLLANILFSNTNITTQIADNTNPISPCTIVEDQECA